MGGAEQHTCGWKPWLLSAFDCFRKCSALFDLLKPECPVILNISAGLITSAHPFITSRLLKPESSTVMNVLKNDLKPFRMTMNSVLKNPPVTKVLAGHLWCTIRELEFYVMAFYLFSTFSWKWLHSTTGPLALIDHPLQEGDLTFSHNGL